MGYVGIYPKPYSIYLRGLYLPLMLLLYSWASLLGVANVTPFKNPEREKGALGNGITV